MNDKLIMKDGKPHKIVEVVMLPTKNKPRPIERWGAWFFDTTDGKYSNRTNGIPGEKPGCAIEGQHLYILSSEEIKEENVYGIFNNEIGYTIKQRDVLCFHIPAKNGRGSFTFPYPRNFKNDVKKIIATTDSSLFSDTIRGEIFALVTKFPRPSDDFIKAFVEEQGKIYKVLVEYIYKEGLGSATTDINNNRLGDKLKIAPDNTITIKPFEEKASWNKEEVIEILKKFDIEMGDTHGPTTRNKWIEENL